MPRVRSDDYDLKLDKILDAAAELFAQVGYPAAKMQDIAQACGATKSMLYHYFPTKDDLLFAMLEQHLEQLLASLEAAVLKEGAPEERVLALVRAYTQKSPAMRRRHISAMNDVKFLPPAGQEPLIKLQKKVLAVTSSLLQHLRPGLPRRSYTPYAMLLLGMLNWTDFWYRPEGPIKPRELCDRIMRLFLHGFLSESA